MLPLLYDRDSKRFYIEVTECGKDTDSVFDSRLEDVTDGVLELIKEVIEK